MASKRDSRSSRSQRTQTSGRRLSGEATGLRSDKTLPSVRSPSGDTTTSRSRKSSSRSRKSDTSTTSRSKRTPSALSEEEVEEKSGTLTSTSVPSEQVEILCTLIGRILELSERVTRKVRTFVSRPIRQPAMRKFIARLELRKQAELAMKDQRKLNDGDVSFPREKMKRAAERAQSGPPEDMFINVSHDSFACLPSTSVAEETNLKERTETGCALVTGNNDNDGQVIVDGHPFWLEENENEDTDTADDLPLNAEVVLDVDEGKIQLATIPKIPVVLDPFGDFSTLQKRDKLFFNKALLFGNSVRSMINLSDMTSVRARRRTKRNKGKPNFITPTTRYFYTVRLSSLD
ncbi:hypothetical protein Y032_0067g22 [Ancylostoma ceylanicum]|uniref:Uncharacterized protein n=1 Tax=Ancylostoma ceylanicum TaxID=53326 RepID=A0A016TZB2_9BILA|nr:hypothetical protein Y032_0067g22 [Ancylostoma ceylanicum]